MPGTKPHKVKKPKKIATPEAATAKPMETVKPVPVQSKPAPALPVLPKYALFPLPAFDGAMASFERSCEVAGQGAQAFNAKLIDIARSNVTSGFDFMASLATAKHPSEAIRLQMSYWESCMRTLIGQGRELQMLSAAIVTKANEPIRAHLTQSLKAA
jgi:Phasin protein